MAAKPGHHSFLPQAGNWAPLSTCLELLIQASDFVLWASFSPAAFHCLRLGTLPPGGPVVWEGPRQLIAPSASVPLTSPRPADRSRPRSPHTC